VAYDCSCGLIQSCCKWVYISVTSSKPRNVTHPLYSTAGLAKILRARVQAFYKFRETLNVNWKVNGWIRIERIFLWVQHVSVRGISILLFIATSFITRMFYTATGLWRSYMYFFMVFLYTNLPLTFLRLCSYPVSSALRSMCAITIYPFFKRLLTFKCQIISVYLRLYKLGCLVFIICNWILRSWNLEATANTSLKLRRWKICKIQAEKVRGHRKTRTNDHSKQEVKCGMSLR
jgi:hypothetical protein